MKVVAVLIDGDNASPKNMAKIFTELNSLGSIKIKRVYGDFSNQNLNSWKPVVNRLGIKTMHGFNYTKGKNSTDINLIIDAMDLIHNCKIDIFCIVSSDCDFTGLVSRVKEAGIYVIGVGKMSSCAPYKEACDRFIEEESLPMSPLLSKNESITKVESFGRNGIKIDAPKLPGLKIVGKIDLQ